eukprot:1122309-Prymnesium_polylepis.1
MHKTRVACTACDRLGEQRRYGTHVPPCQRHLADHVAATRGQTFRCLLRSNSCWELRAHAIDRH